LRRALPQAATAQLGNIGGDIPVGMQAANFGDAKTKLEAFADAIFNDPSCKGLYSGDEQKAVKDLVIGKALEYTEAADADGFSAAVAIAIGQSASK
jgi:hypothetical protein